MKFLLGLAVGAYFGGALATYWADEHWGAVLEKQGMIGSEGRRGTDHVVEEMHVGIDPQHT